MRAQVRYERHGGKEEMRKALLALLLISYSPLHAQNAPKIIKPTKEELSLAKRHQDIIAKVNAENAALRAKQQKDYREVLGIEQWMATQHPGYTYDTSMDVFIEIPPPPAVKAPDKPAEPEKPKQ